jgi:hypothetical protein
VHSPRFIVSSLTVSNLAIRDHGLFLDLRLTKHLFKKSFTLNISVVIDNHS